MHILKSNTDAGAHVIFDPASLVAEKVSWTLIPELAQSGRLAFYDAHGDGGATFWIYVDEAPPPEILGKTIVVKRNGTLRIESGTLWAVGQEYVFDLNLDSVERARQWKPKAPDMGTCMTIGRGAYSVDAYVRKWEDFDERENRYIDASLSADEKSRLSKNQHLKTSGCFVTILLCCLPLLSAVLPERFKDIAIAVCFCGLPAVWGLVYALKDKEVSRKLVELRRELDQKEFDALLVLRPCASNNAGSAEGIIMDEDDAWKAAERGKDAGKNG